MLGPRNNEINWSYPFELIDEENTAYALLSQEDRILVDNMRYSLALDNASSVHFLDDYGCSLATSKLGEQVFQLYSAEYDLRFKSDICRIAALYLEGGIYNDDDQINYRPIMPWLKQQTTFAGVQTDLDANVMANSFLAATPCHPTIRLILQWMLKARQPGVDILKPDGLLGPRCTRYAVKEVEDKNYSALINTTQLLRETQLRFIGMHPDRYGHQCTFGFYDPHDNNTIYACSRV